MTDTASRLKTSVLVATGVALVGFVSAVALPAHADETKAIDAFVYDVVVSGPVSSSCRATENTLTYDIYLNDTKDQGQLHPVTLTVDGVGVQTVTPEHQTGTRLTGTFTTTSDSLGVNVIVDGEDGPVRAWGPNGETFTCTDDPTPTPTATASPEPTTTSTPAPTSTPTTAPTIAPTSEPTAAPSPTTGAPADLVAALSSRSVQPGAALTVTASGFAPGESLAVYLHSTPRLLWSGTANAAGAISATVTIPLDTEAGSHRIEVRAASGQAAFADLTVTPLELAATGTESTTTGLLGVAAIGIVALGGALIWVRRRNYARAEQ